MFWLIQFDSIHLSTYFITSNYQNHNDLLLIILLNCHKIIVRIYMLCYYISISICICIYVDMSINIYIYIYNCFYSINKQQ